MRAYICTHASATTLELERVPGGIRGLHPLPPTTATFGLCPWPGCLYLAGQRALRPEGTDTSSGKNAVHGKEGAGSRSPSEAALACEGYRGATAGNDWALEDICGLMGKGIASLHWRKGTPLSPAPTEFSWGMHPMRSLAGKSGGGAPSSVFFPKNRRKLRN